MELLGNRCRPRDFRSKDKKKRSWSENIVKEISIFVSSFMRMVIDWDEKDFRLNLVISLHDDLNLIS